MFIVSRRPNPLCQVCTEELAQDLGLGAALHLHLDPEGRVVAYLGLDCGKPQGETR